MIFGDFNVKIGRRVAEKIVGKYGFSDRNDRKDMLVHHFYH